MELQETPSSIVKQQYRDRIAVVINGNARKVSAEVVSILDEIIQGGDLFVSRSLEEANEIADRIVELGYPIVLTGGGDGTFVQMVSFIVKKSKTAGRPAPRFGLLKLGTGNALAWALGANGSAEKGVFADIARLRQQGGHQELRLLEVEGMLTPFAGMGGDAVALQHFQDVKSVMQKLPVLRTYGTGLFSYGLSIAGKSLPTFALMPQPYFRVINRGEPAQRIGLDGQPTGKPLEAGETMFEGSTKAVLLSTIPYWGFGARVFPFADDRPDRFQVRVVDISSLDLIRHLPSIWKGTYRSPKVWDFFAQSIEIQSREPVDYQIGGDPMGKRSTLHASLYSEPIKVVNYYAPPPVH